MRTLYILLFFNFIFSSLSFAQTSYELGGKVASNSGKPLAAVKVVLIQESKQIQMEVTDKSGRFQFENVGAGGYTIRLLFLGFESKSIPVQISKNTDLKTIMLSPKSKQIEEVVISTDRMTKASNIDKKEYSPSQLLSSQNASAAELINNLPSMNLGGEGNDLSFRGDDKVAIMINGKITALTGENLSQIPANSIEKIEVISVPGSKYNSDGSAGVINIILKNAKANFNGGYVLQSIGNNNKYNSQLGYNWSSAKWAINGAYNYTYNEFENNGNSQRRYLDNVDLNAYNHTSDGERVKRLHNLRIGAEYIIDTQNTISVIGSLSKDWGSSFSSDNDTFRDNMMVINQQWNLNNTEKDINTIYDINLAWSHLMSNKKDKFSLEISRSDNINDRSQVYRQAFNTYERIASKREISYRVDNKQRRPITAIQADHMLNINSKNLLESGLRIGNKDFRFENTYTDISSGEVIVPRWTNDFRFEENVFSGYGMLSTSWNEKLTTKIGMRLEQTNTQSYNYDSALYQYNYFNALPSATIRYQLSPKGGNIGGSYGLRINRPGPGMLNPIQDVADPISKRYGNPTIKPEIIHSFELAYGNDISKKVSMSSSVYAKFSENSIARYLIPNTDGTFSVNIENIGKQLASGWEAIGTIKLSKSNSINVSSNLAYNELSFVAPTGLVYDQKFISWQGRGIWSLKLPLGIESQLVAFYKSPFRTPQGVVDFNSNIDLTLRKKVMNNKGMIILSVFDILNHTRFELDASDVNFTNHFIRKRETRYATISFRYNFGAEPKKAPKERPEPREGGGGDM